MSTKVASAGLRTQLAAVPWRMINGDVEILMITSRLSRHWLIPKGWPMNGKTNAQAAAREAYEEAGVKGTISRKPIGRYRYQKLLADGTALPCFVDVYALRVEKELASWPEADDRERLWVTPDEAARVVFEPDLAAFLGSVSQSAIVESIAD